ncbi:MAG: DUF4282 domain-containing protein [Hyphomonadaceae bacterium]
MLSFFQRFLTFDRLIGPMLVRLVYYVGLAVITFGAIGVLFAALMSIFTGNFPQGIVQLIMAPLVAAVGLLYWRFVCELFMLAFRGYERLGQVRDLMRIAAGQAPSEADPNHPSF